VTLCLIYFQQACILPLKSGYPWRIHIFVASSM
jgi:hypothetical protein